MGKYGVRFICFSKSIHITREDECSRIDKVLNESQGMSGILKMIRIALLYHILFSHGDLDFPWGINLYI